MIDYLIYFYLFKIIKSMDKRKVKITNLVITCEYTITPI